MVALQRDLHTLEQKYNECSEHLAHGETQDFNQVWLSRKNMMKHVFANVRTDIFLKIFCMPIAMIYSQANLPYRIYEQFKFSPRFMSYMLLPPSLGLFFSGGPRNPKK